MGVFAIHRIESFKSPTLRFLMKISRVLSSSVVATYSSLHLPKVSQGGLHGLLFLHTCINNNHNPYGTIHFVINNLGRESIYDDKVWGRDYNKELW